MRVGGVFSYCALIALTLMTAYQAPGFAADRAPTVKTDLPDAIHGPSADRIPPGLACSDNMDFAPEDNLPNPFDADLVAFHAEDQPAASPAPFSQNCDGRPKVDLS
ncbi:MAG TPA: hypothetical protein VG501_00470 [Rhizomicrobium sp.]|nr:hypothetical protein [Rhizomicrobium sp.]